MSRPRKTSLPVNFNNTGGGKLPKRCRNKKWPHWATMSFISFFQNYVGSSAAGVLLYLIFSIPGQRGPKSYGE
ncbi:hypothetical protein N752_11825 [Desulforamulus aquiferis]|nr:hypothetical protein N752_11825 [Desulforamulus aquiferis]